MGAGPELRRSGQQRAEEGPLVAAYAAGLVADPVGRDEVGVLAYALFSFPSFADYERYRARFGEDPDFVAADRIRDESGCVRRYERTFLRPLLP